jgi:hypothetical protein
MKNGYLQFEIDSETYRKLEHMAELENTSIENIIIFVIEKAFQEALRKYPTLEMSF